MLSSEYSILLIDDDADVLDAYTQLLEQSGYRVFACNNPFEAQAWIQPDWPGIVLSDVYAWLLWYRFDDVIPPG